MLPPNEEPRVSHRIVGVAAKLLLLIGVFMGASTATAAKLAGVCPDRYQVKVGLNVDFPSDGRMRAFFVYAPADLSRPVPVWVPLTGSVESTNDNLHAPRSGANALMAAKGFMVLGPVRDCAAQDPALSAGVCNGPGVGGWNWRPWMEGRAAGPSGDAWKNDEGPDSRFLVAMVRCVATKYPLDDRRLFIGGISSGGTMTNRALTFHSDFWAGGMPISGEWYVTGEDGKALSFEGARAAVKANPTMVFQGRVGPYPLKTKLGPMIVVNVWGGDRDMWRCAGNVLCSDYRPTTQSASNYYGSMSDVVDISCTSSHGHMWPQINTQAFNAWALKTLASHPKGSSAASFHLTPPPEGYACKLGPYTDHY
jgi:poly(3-hydroxybutyrate) depolymerase